MFFLVTVFIMCIYRRVSIPNWDTKSHKHLTESNLSPLQKKIFHGDALTKMHKIMILIVYLNQMSSQPFIKERALAVLQSWIALLLNAIWRYTCQCKMCVFCSWQEPFCLHLCIVNLALICVIWSTAPDVGVKIWLPFDFLLQHIGSLN